MKRLFFALAVAVVFHLLVLGLDVSLDREKPQLAGKTRDVTVTLSRRPGVERKRITVPVEAGESKSVTPPERPLKGNVQRAVVPVGDAGTERSSSIPPDPPVIEEIDEGVEVRPLPPVVGVEWDEISDVNPVAVDTADRGKTGSEVGTGAINETGDADVTIGGFIDAEAVPLYRSNPVPGYPGLARKRGYDGVVLLDVMVTADGTVSEMKMAESSGYAVLDRAALAAVGKWLFAPGVKGGRKVAMWVRVPVRFELER